LVLPLLQNRHRLPVARQPSILTYREFAAPGDIRYITSPDSGRFSPTFHSSDIDRSDVVSEGKDSSRLQTGTTYSKFDNATPIIDGWRTCCVPRRGDRLLHEHGNRETSSGGSRSSVISRTSPAVGLRNSTLHVAGHTQTERFARGEGPYALQFTDGVRRSRRTIPSSQSLTSRVRPLRCRGT